MLSLRTSVRILSETPLYPRLELLLHKTLQTFLHMNLQTLAR